MNEPWQCPGCKIWYAQHVAQCGCEKKWPVLSGDVTISNSANCSFCGVRMNCAKDHLCQKKEEFLKGV